MFSGPVEDGVASQAEKDAALREALLRERDGYIRKGDAKRVAGVEAALVAYGLVEVEPEAEQAALAKPEAEQATTKGKPSK